ncbi:AraC family transcriptional regulator [Massilia sp. NR 4-1]|uniref:AraC family transcriptional regulator n=1 Tax=Massilia sp. NR 4-1 TaxID=1678028 RepID=UPI00067A7F06|nr:AraC family transcriptional regulator [Massilia sp. NR 4-1]AKU20896.1 AraC family transcriptional regulator [Massilia sp. NR 4-1]
MIAFHTIGDACIAAGQQPALALDYARSRDAADSALLRGLWLDASVLSDPASMITPGQYHQLLANTLRALNSPDTSFMLGQHLLPGHNGAISHALLHAQNLRQALELLTAWHARLTPLLCPRLREENGIAVLYWVDSYGAPSLLPALVEMHMTAVAAMCRWLGGERLPWRFCFNRAAPAHVEQHEVHLGSELRFNCHLDAMLIDSTWLDRPWPRGNAVAASVALRNAAGEAAALPSLLDAMYDYLLERVRRVPSQEQAAADFGASPATLKRYLSRHGTHFQAELDQVRTHVALHLFHSRRADNEAVAQYLGFHDATNFRRSFKRWTGKTPALLRDALLA